MSSHKQVEANRRNALKSTGPATPEGKERSRCNAVRHGLTAETIIGTLEDEADYQAFEAAIIADYDAESAVERELVLRLASVLWRLRRATGIESALFEFATTDDCKHKQLTSPEIAPDIPDHSEREHLFPATPQTRHPGKPGAELRFQQGYCGQLFALSRGIDVPSGSSQPLRAPFVATSAPASGYLGHLTLR